MRYLLLMVEENEAQRDELPWTRRQLINNKADYESNKSKMLTKQI